VVEVGVDVPNATCMIIEHAEHFGLSALHQLRGRVGRGSAQSYAFLVYSRSLQEDGKRRLKVMKDSHDGFVIAEQDLLIRGPGEIAGTRQSGYLSLVFADIIRDLELMKEARTDAAAVLAQDSGLLNGEHTMIREMLARCSPFDEHLIE
jgi:ATP-dependent DNA helicase RecG